MRLFAAIRPSPRVLEELRRVCGRLLPKAPNEKWIPADNIHITLSFVGHVADEDAGKYAAALRKAAFGSPTFALHYAGLGSFGQVRSPTVLWIGVSRPPAELAVLHRKINEEFHELGLDPERRPFSPHLTLARARERGGSAALAQCAASPIDVDLGQDTVDEIVLFRSHLGRNGARYEPIETVRLA